MIEKLTVLPKKAYEIWLAEAGSADDDLPLEELGEKLYPKKHVIHVILLMEQHLLGLLLETSQMGTRKSIG